MQANRVVRLFIFIFGVYIRVGGAPRAFAFWWIHFFTKNAPHTRFWKYPWFSQTITDVCDHFQEDIAEALGLPYCRYCRWVVYEDDPHDFCISELSPESQLLPEISDDAFQKTADEIRQAWIDYYAPSQRSNGLMN